MQDDHVLLKVELTRSPGGEVGVGGSAYKIFDTMLLHSCFFSRALLTPFSAEKNHLCSYGKGHHVEHFCEIILNSNEWFRRKCH